ISRALLDAQMPHAAHQGFVVTASAVPTPDTAGAHSASLQCLVEIHRRHGSLGIPRTVALRLPGLIGLTHSDPNVQAAWRRSAREAGALRAIDLANEEVTSAPEL